MQPDLKQVSEETVEELIAWLAERGITISFDGATVAPTQPLQGSEVERYEVFCCSKCRKPQFGSTCCGLPSSVSCARVEMVRADDHTALQVQLQRVEEERDKAREQTEAMAWAAGWETDGAPAFEFETVRKQIIERGHEDSQDYADALDRATQAEARIQGAAKTFEDWAAIEESRIAGAESKSEREAHRLAALAAKRCAEHLRSQSSSEAGGGELMPEGAFVQNDELVEPGDTRCTHWPSTCAEVQAQSMTTFRFCDFCLYGPPEPPTRSDGTAMSLEEAQERIAKTERARGERLREAICAVMEESK